MWCVVEANRHYWISLALLSVCELVIGTETSLVATLVASATYSCGLTRVLSVLSGIHQGNHSDNQGSLVTHKINNNNNTRTISNSP